MVGTTTLHALLTTLGCSVTEGCWGCWWSCVYTGFAYLFFRKWTKLTKGCQRRHYEQFSSQGWIWSLLVRETGYTFLWPHWSLSAFYCSHHCFLIVISPLPLEIQTTLTVSREECQSWCHSGQCFCQMMMVITTKNSPLPCQLLKD